MFSEFGINAGFVEDLHAQYRQSPQSVDEEWRAFFRALDAAPAPAGPDRNGGMNGVQPVATPRARTNGNALASDDRALVREDNLLAAAALQGRVYQLVNAYRVRGHQFAKIDPLGTAPEGAPELELANFGLS